MQKQQAKKLPKHHYIPEFYLKQWVGGDGRLCEFSKKYLDVKPRRTAPGGTGYVRGLYRLPNVAEEKAEIIETIYLKAVDNGAAVALQKMLAGGPAALTDIDKVRWARFLHCLMLRSPEYLDGIGKILKRDVTDVVENSRAEYDRMRSPTDPATFDEFKSRFLSNPLNTSANRILHKLVDDSSIAPHLCTMKWYMVRFDGSPNLMLTSDRPIIMTNGIRGPEAHIALPISPHVLFIALADAAGYRSIRSIPTRELIRLSNTRVAEQARDYVYGLSDASLNFVAGRLGKRLPATPLETGVLNLAEK